MCSKECLYLCHSRTPTRRTVPVRVTTQTRRQTVCLVHRRIHSTRRRVPNSDYFFVCVVVVPLHLPIPIRKIFSVLIDQEDTKRMPVFHSLFDTLEPFRVEERPLGEKTVILLFRPPRLSAQSEVVFLHYSDTLFCCVDFHQSCPRV